MNYAGALIVLNGDIVTKTIWGSHGPGFKRTRQRVLRIKLLSGFFFSLRYLEVIKKYLFSIWVLQSEVTNSLDPDGSQWGIGIISFKY